MAASFTTVNAQQQQQLTSQSSAIENRTAATQSTKDSISLQVPQGWIIQDVNNTGFVLGAEILQGYGILAQLCPEEEEEREAGATLPKLAATYQVATASGAMAVKELKKN